MKKTKHHLFLASCLLIFGLLQSVFAQNHTVTGKVNNDKGEPVAGATVTATNSGYPGVTKSTVTNSKGEFSIQVASYDALTVTSVGYEPKQISIGGQNTIAVTLVSRLGNMDNHLKTP